MPRSGELEMLELEVLPERALVSTQWELVLGERDRDNIHVYGNVVYAQIMCSS